MITLHRLNGQVVAINPDLVTWIDITPDTTVSFLGGDRIMVRESLSEVIDHVVAYRASIRVLAGASDASPPSEGVIDQARVLRTSGHPPQGYRANRTPPPPPPSPFQLPDEAEIDPSDLPPRAGGL